jgi:hypothetical protein
VPALKLDKYGGMLPAWDDLLLPAGQGAYVRDAYLYSGALIGWRKPKLLRALTDTAAKFVYRVPVITQAVAKAYLVFTSNAAQGDTVKIDVETYTFTATVTNPYDVLLGATATDSADNLLKALLGTGTNGVTYGEGTVPNTILDQTGDCTATTHDYGSGAVPVLSLAVSDFGDAFNTVVAIESTANARLVWISDITNLASTTTTFTGGANQAFDSTITGSATWLEFPDRETDVIRSPVVDDQFGRYYFASPSLSPRYNTYARIAAGQPHWLLGVPAPGCAPTVSVTGGGNLAQLGRPASTGGGVTYAPLSSLILIPITPTGAMELDQVSFQSLTDVPTLRAFGVLYDDNGSGPDQLLNTGVEIIGATAGGSVTSVFQNPTGLLQGVKYWIGFMVDSEVGIQQFDGTTSEAVIKSATYTNGAPLFVGAVSSIPSLQMWGDLTTSSVLAARAYVYTWVTEYNEEGPPSPPTLVNGWSNGTWAVGLFQPPPDDVGVKRNITHSRIYRTVTASNGLASYFFVAEVPVAQADYTDQSDDAVVALNRLLPSLTWFPPPENLQGMIAMPNGIVAGFRGNEIWFSEPYQPHAWPPENTLTTEFPIVGLGSIGQVVVACTSSRPYVASGVNPSTMTLTKVALVAPCTSRGSILSTPTGVYYHSPIGLIQVTETGGGVATNMTENWVTREKWQQLTPQSGTHAILLASSYFAFECEGGTAGFSVELADDVGSFSIWPQPGGHRRGFEVLSAPDGNALDCVLTDQWSGVGLTIHDGAVYYYDFTDATPDFMPYRWRSRKYQTAFKKNFAAMKVFFSVPASTPTQNETRQELDTDDSAWDTLADDQYGIIRVFADDVLVTTREIRTSGEMLRILGDFKADVWQFEIDARVNITNVQAATSVKELGQV